jgi:hypothetical protein
MSRLMIEALPGNSESSPFVGLSSIFGVHSNSQGVRHENESKHPIVVVCMPRSSADIAGFSSEASKLQEAPLASGSETSGTPDTAAVCQTDRTESQVHSTSRWPAARDPLAGDSSSKDAENV